jgi:hypothetical protein
LSALFFSEIIFSENLFFQEAEKRKEVEKSLVLKWTDPDMAIEAKRSTFYSLARIEEEEKAMGSSPPAMHFNTADWFQEPILWISISAETFRPKTFLTNFHPKTTDT